jgi:hypothetical protein
MLAKAYFRLRPDSALLTAVPSSMAGTTKNATQRPMNRSICSISPSPAITTMLKNSARPA